MVGHTEEGCNAKKGKAKTTKADPPKTTEAIEMGTSTSSMALKGQGSQSKWVTKQPKANTSYTNQSLSKGAESFENPVKLLEANSPQNGNKFSVLAKLSEAEVDQSQVSGSEDRVVQVPRHSS